MFSTHVKKLGHFLSENLKEFLTEPRNVWGNLSFWYELKWWNCTKILITASMVCVWTRKNILGGYSSFFKPKVWNYLRFDWINLCRVVKSSQLPVKISAYLVSIGQLLCLEFLYRWRFSNEISLDWPLTLTTQLSTSTTIFIFTTIEMTCVKMALYQNDQ